MTDQDGPMITGHSGYESSVSCNEAKDCHLPEVADGGFQAPGRRARNSLHSQRSHS
ncbi:MAG: hypothetical protein KatS3mg108_2617 [Isosphaeraceae bacterium]|jgi:hypothetical protein|nr:MAG: hypothetical protein KatS3mg108_2617 [Isosphaeraceae bacterium]